MSPNQSLPHPLVSLTTYHALSLSHKGNGEEKTRALCQWKQDKKKKEKRTAWVC